VREGELVLLLAAIIFQGWECETTLEHERLDSQTTVNSCSHSNSILYSCFIIFKASAKNNEMIAQMDKKKCVLISGGGFIFYVKFYPK
jgi:hypothetical protein